MTRLILLNGPPGVGKSTLAARYAADHPGTLCCDIDVLRTMVGGWDTDYPATGVLVRPAALAFVEAYLRASGDVVLPQLLSQEAELARFEGAASAAGAGSVHVLLEADPATAVVRFERREVEPHLAAITSVVDEEGGPAAVVSGYAAALADLVTRRPGIRRLDASGDPGTTYAALLAMLA